MKVILTEGGNKNTLAIARYLGRIGKYSVSILHHKKTAVFYSKYCHEFIVCPDIHEKKEYYNFLIKLLREKEYDLLIPVGSRSVNIVSKNKLEISNYCKTIIPNYETVIKALDKNKTFKLAHELELPYPKTIYCNNIEQVLSESEKLKYPLVLKSANESNLKIPAAYINSKTELEKTLKELIQSHALFSKNFPVIQEKIEGEAYGFFAIYQEGRCKKYFMHRRIREFPVTGGVSTCATSIYDKTLYETGKKILDELQWEGPVMVEFKKNMEDGRYYIIEINPKFWGSLELCLAAGQNFPKYLCDIAEGIELDYENSYKVNLIFQWLFSYFGEFYRLKSKPGDLIKVLKTIFNRNSRTEIWIKDIKPNMVDIKNYFSYLINIKH
jgi:predicted ATP-grasp superfamily ATP-dependent carboligase